MTYIMSEYEYGVACIAHGEEEATVMFLLKAGFVGFDGDDVLLKQQAGSYSPMQGATGGNVYTRMGQHGEEKPGQMPGVFTTPDGASFQPTKAPGQLAFPGFGHDAQVRRFARKQGMEPTRAAAYVPEDPSKPTGRMLTQNRPFGVGGPRPVSGRKSGEPSAMYDFGEGAPKIPASLMERAKAKLGRMRERGAKFSRQREQDRGAEGLVGSLQGESEDTMDQVLARVAREIGRPVSELGKPEKDAAPATSAQEAAPPAAPTPEVPTDVAPEPAPDPTPAPEPKTAPTADPAAGVATRAAIKDKTKTTGKVKVEPKTNEEFAEQMAQDAAKENEAAKNVTPKSPTVGGEPVDAEMERRKEEMKALQAQIDAKTGKIAGTTPSTEVAPEVPPATMTAPEGEKMSAYQEMMEALSGVKGYGGTGRALGSLVGRFRDASGNPITEEGDLSLPLQLGDKGLTDTMAQRLREGYENEANQEMMRRYFGPDFTGTFAPKQPVGGGPQANIDFSDDPVNPTKIELSYDSPMDLAWDALLFRKTHQ